MADKRASNRIKESNDRKVLDEAARERRMKKELEKLMQDNHIDDPFSDDEEDAKLPQFGDKLQAKGRRGRRNLKTEPFKQRCRKNFVDLLEDELRQKKQFNYLKAQVPPSKYPPRKWCAVCGFEANYTCPSCGAKYCSVKCYDVHKDTRCLKWCV